nr:MAG TPA: hypothetical protein [Caudoviricetes sp.]
MPVNHWKGIPLPEAGDDLLSAWSKAFDVAGVIFPAQSVAEAREILSRAEAAGHPPTAAHPAYLDVSGVLYRADGSKNSGRWVIHPANEVQAAEAGIGRSYRWQLSSNQTTDVATIDLGVRPYDRLIQASWTCFGIVHKGVVDIFVAIMDRYAYARFPLQTFGTTVTANVMAIVPAGQAPRIRAGFTGGQGIGGDFSFTDSKQYSGLIATATPKGMQ